MALLIPAPVKAVEDFAAPSIRSSVREFYSTNRENRFLIKVHIWGDASQTGVYFVPDNTTMMDIMSLTGGPMGVFDKTVISLTATQPNPPKKERVTNLRIDGRDILEKAEYRNFVLQNGDVIHIDSPAASDTFMKSIGIISSVLGLVTTGLSIYLVTKSK